MMQEEPQRLMNVHQLLRLTSWLEYCRYPNKQCKLFSQLFSSFNCSHMLQY